MTLSELSKALSDKNHKNVPEHCRPVKKFSDNSANNLTKAIIAYADLKDWFAERQSSEGRFRPGKEYENVLGKKVQMKGTWLGGHGKGKADIKAVIRGRSIEIEVKHGSDRLKPDQIEYKEKIERAGGIYIVVKTWQDFLFQIKKYE